MNKSIGNTRYVNETKIYAKKDQYKVTADNVKLEYIVIANNTVGIRGDSLVI